MRRVCAIVFMGSLSLGVCASQGVWEWEPAMAAGLNAPDPPAQAWHIFQYTGFSSDKDTDPEEQQQWDMTYGEPVAINSGWLCDWVMTSSDPAEGEKWLATVEAWGGDVAWWGTDAYWFWDWATGEMPGGYMPARDDPDVWPAITIVVQPVTGWIEGIVSDAETGEPVQGATFELDAGQYPEESDQQGHYEIHQVAPGEHALTCSATGYEQQQATVQVVAGEGYFRNFSLTPEEMEPPEDPPPEDPPPEDPPPEDPPPEDPPPEDPPPEDPPGEP